MTANQRILAEESRFSLYRDLLEDEKLTFHQLAGRIEDYIFIQSFEGSPHAMPTETELGYSLLRLVQEGLINMDTIEHDGSFAVKRKPSIKLEQTHEAAVLPDYQHDGDAGADVRSVTETVILPGARVLIDLGFKIQIEDGWEIQARPRSGLALKKGITVLNAPGTIDSVYRGQCGIILVNTSTEPFPVRVGDRIAQFVVKRAPQANFEWTESVTTSNRGEGGFGSTGVQ